MDDITTVRDVCPDCGQSVVVNKSGLLRKHPCVDAPAGAPEPVPDVAEPVSTDGPDSAPGLMGVDEVRELDDGPGDVVDPAPRSCAVADCRRAANIREYCTSHWYAGKRKVRDRHG